MSETREPSSSGPADAAEGTESVTWLTIPDVAERLDVKITQVHRLIEQRALIAARHDGVARIPDVFLLDGEPRPDLRGTIVVLGDAGFTDDQAVDWLLSPHDELDQSPIQALIAGRKAIVRRVAASEAL